MDTDFRAFFLGLLVFFLYEIKDAVDYPIWGQVAITSVLDLIIFLIQGLPIELNAQVRKYKLADIHFILLDSLVLAYLLIFLNNVPIVVWNLSILTWLLKEPPKLVSPLLHQINKLLHLFLVVLVLEPLLFTKNFFQVGLLWSQRLIWVGPTFVFGHIFIIHS